MTGSTGSTGYGVVVVLVLSSFGCGATDVRPDGPAERSDGAEGIQAEGEAQVAPVTLDCAFGGVTEQRYRRDCDRELVRLSEQTTAFEGQIASLDAETIAPVRAALTNLVDQRRQLCHDWNACALSRSEHMNRYDWVSDELATLGSLLSDTTGVPATRQTGLRSWASGLQNRRPTAGPSVTPASASDASMNANSVTPNPGAEAQMPPPPVPNQEMMAVAAQAQAAAQRRVKVVFMQQERELVELKAFLGVVQKLRAASAPPSQYGAPPLCTKIEPTRAQLTGFIRGPNSVVNSMSRSVLDGANELCGRYERWAQPDERTQGQIESLLAHVDRIDNWMNEILACINPGPYNYPCQNTFGSLEPGDEAQARKTRRILKQVRHELRGVKGGQRRFPCDAPLWSKLQQQQWNESVARAQMPRLGLFAEQVCETIGIDQESITKSQKNFQQRLDSSESSLAAHIRTREEALARLRQYIQ